MIFFGLHRRFSNVGLWHVIFARFAKEWLQVTEDLALFLLQECDAIIQKSSLSHELLASVNQAISVVLVYIDDHVACNGL